MHVHLPKPLHGWRAFVGEVGIIVIGVLIALSAEQLIEWVHWQAKVGGAETAIGRDLALQSDLASERVALSSSAMMTGLPHSAQRYSRQGIVGPQFCRQPPTE